LRGRFDARRYIVYGIRHEPGAPGPPPDAYCAGKLQGWFASPAGGDISAGAPLDNAEPRNMEVHGCCLMIQ